MTAHNAVDLTARSDSPAEPPRERAPASSLAPETGGVPAATLPPRALAPTGLAVAAVAAGVAAALAATGTGSATAVVALVATALIAATAATVAAVRRAERLADALMIAERRMVGLGDTAHEWLWTSDASGRFTYSNHGVHELVGLRPEEVVGRPLAEVFVGEADGAGVHVRTNTGHTVPVEARIRPLRDNAGRLVGHEGAVRPPADERRAARRLTLLREQTLEILDRDRLDMALQPIVALADGRTIGMEALARFPGRAPRPPDAWFRLAGEVGLGQNLELLAVRSALRHLPALPPDVFLSINVSAATITQPAFTRLLEESERSLRRLMLEVTEHESIEQYDEIATALDPLRARGLSLAVDDAGAGYASFRHVVQLRPDQIKLDRGLVSGIHRDPARRALASALVVFALEVGAGVIAEGVECAEELDVLQSLSVDAAQGFYLGRPAPAPTPWDHGRAAS